MTARTCIKVTHLYITQLAEKFDLRTTMLVRQGRPGGDSVGVWVGRARQDGQAGRDPFLPPRSLPVHLRAGTSRRC